MNSLLDGTEFKVVSVPEASEITIDPNSLRVHKSAIDVQFDLLNDDDDEGASLLRSALSTAQGQLCLITLNENQEVISTEPLQYDGGNLENLCAAESERGACDALELAMQEIGQEADVIEPVSYEVKMAALKAMVPHTKRNSAASSVTCDLCLKSFSKTNDLKNHLCQHLGLQLSLCFYCGRQFTNMSNLNRHLRIHTGEKPFLCTTCGKRFRQTSTLHMHKLHVHGGATKKHGCPSCGRLYKSIYLLKRHCKITHKDENIDVQVQQADTAAPQKRVFYCVFCGTHCPLKADLKKHIREAHQQEEVRQREIQEEIEDIYSVLDEIDDDARNHHAERVPQPVPEDAATSGADEINQTIEEVIHKMNSFICFQCGKQLHKFVSYKQHWGIHDTALRKYSCELCGVSFAWRTTLKSHMAKNHSQDSESESLITCKEVDCGKTYKSRKQMMEHVKRDHRLVRKFKCDECDKQFFKSHDLIVHKRTHSKEKPYICSTCGKSFSHVSHVIRHERVHKNIRPHVCPCCKKAFSQASVLKAHRRNKCPESTSIDAVDEELYNTA